MRDRGHRPRHLDRGDLVSAHRQHPGAAPLPRQGDDRARVSCGPAAGNRGDGCPPRAARVSRSSVHAAQPGVRARPYVYVTVFDAGVDPAPGRDHGAAGVDSSRALAAGGVCHSDDAYVGLAAGGRASRTGARRANQSAGSSPVHHRHHGGARQGGTRHRHWRTPGQRSPRGLGALVPAGGGRTRGSAWWLALGWAVFGLAYVGAVVFVSSYLRAPASSVLLVLAAGARLSGYIGATVGEIGFLRGFWMDGSRRLAWLEDYAASVAAAGDLPVPPALQQGGTVRSCFLCLPGYFAGGARGCVAVRCLRVRWWRS